MSVRRASPLTITFPLVDSSNRPLRKPDLTFQTSWALLVTPSGTVFPTNLPAHVWGGRYSLQLTAQEMDADWVHLVVEAPGCDPWDQLLGTSGHPSATATGSGTATAFETTLAESVTDYWKNCLVTFSTGPLTAQVRRVTGYDGTTKALTVDSAFTQAPDAGDRFLIVSL